MIKYFCDFCKEEIPIIKEQYKEEIKIQIIKQDVNGSRIIKAEHVCEKCNNELVDEMKDRGLEVI